MLSISPEELNDRLQHSEPIEIVDVRTPAEFRALHVDEARNIPLDQLHGATLQELVERSAHRPVYVLCEKGGRSRMACERLIASGAQNVANVDGGTAACVAAGLPVVRGRHAMSLERRVRIAAGGIVLAGAVAAFTVHPAFLWLSAFVGAGLVFSGITNTCGMAVVLGKCPWNRA